MRGKRIFENSSILCGIVGVLAGALSPDMVRGVCELPALN